MFPHGAQRVLGWFGGHGFRGTMKSFADSGIPAVFVLLAIAAEFLGSLGLAVGPLTRIAAFGIACVTLVAILRGEPQATAACPEPICF
jgi:putative oxidoreductase